jgi:hypothetical protein
MDPGEAERSDIGRDMERYLGNLFNHRAVLANHFGWGVGDDTTLQENRRKLKGARRPTENSCATPVCRDDLDQLDQALKETLCRGRRSGKGHFADNRKIVDPLMPQVPFASLPNRLIRRPRQLFQAGGRFGSTANH